jgi:hypothetical protein
MTLDGSDHPQGEAVGRIQEEFRAAARGKEWIDYPGSGIHIYVQYRANIHCYDITAYWIEDWKPGNYGYRMRGDYRVKAEKLPLTEHSKSAMLDTIRQETLDYHWEIGYYPKNEERRKAFWDSSETYSYKDGVETRNPPKNPNAMKEYNERFPD